MNEEFRLTQGFASCPTHGRIAMVETKDGSFYCLYCDYKFTQKIERKDDGIHYYGKASFSIYATPVDFWGTEKGTLKYRAKNIKRKKGK